MLSAQQPPTVADTGWLSTWVSAYAAKNPIDTTFENLDRALAAAPGHRLLTVLVYFESLGESQRAYSSRPLEYPIGGRKTLGQAPRMRQVLSTSTPFIGRTQEDIIANYADHELLLSMGCGSIVNMPVRWGNRVLGTVNLLDAERKYDEHHLPMISAWAQMSAPAFLALLSGMEGS